MYQTKAELEKNIDGSFNQEIDCRIMRKVNKKEIL